MKKNTTSSKGKMPEDIGTKYQLQENRRQCPEQGDAFYCLVRLSHKISDSLHELGGTFLVWNVSA